MGEPSNGGSTFVPAIAGFFCPQCGDDCLSKMGEVHGEIPTSIKSVRVMCAEKVGTDLVREAFEFGADGVLICGCLVGLCKTKDTNVRVLAHIHQTKKALKEMEISPNRLRQEWICAPGGDSVRQIVEEFTEQVRHLGPLQTEVREALQGKV